ncbi:MAG: ADP-ribosylglycohydrolase family protein [Oscillospiraceae bacterium]|nr:ADP-ribosylglycohydrolase family protein [Oscillospiraceae bacterium]
MADWLQCRDEGLEVSGLLARARLLSEEQYLDIRKSLDFNALLLACPMQEGFVFYEPSSLPEILAARPARRHKLNAGYSPATCRDQISGAWHGLSGGGKDTASARFELAVLSLLLMKRHGIHPSPKQMLDGMMESIPYARLFGAERAAYRAGALGISPPETALFLNPWREWGGGLCRGAFWGFLYHGSPEAAARAAYFDLSAAYTKNGLYAGMFAAALLAASAACGNIRVAIETAMDEIPQSSRLSHGLSQVLQLCDAGLPQEEIAARIRGFYDPSPGQYKYHAVPNAMACAAALLYSGYCMERAVSAVCSCGFDSETTAALAASAIGMMTGKQAAECDRQEKFPSGVRTCLAGHEWILFNELVKDTIELMGLISHSS